MNYLRANGYRTYIVTGGGQDFVRVYSENSYGISPEQVVGSAGETTYGYDKDGKPILIKEAIAMPNSVPAAGNGLPNSTDIDESKRPTILNAEDIIGDARELLRALDLPCNGIEDRAGGASQALANIVEKKLEEAVDMLDTIREEA